MNWADWSTFFYMDGYGVYLWSACLAIGAALTIELLLLRLRRRSILDHLGRTEPLQEGGDEAAH